MRNDRCGSIRVIFGCIIAVLTAMAVIREIRKIQNVTGKVASGDFTEKIKVTKNDEFGELETHFNEMIDDVSNLIREVETKSNNILGVADNIFEIAGNTKATMQQVTLAIDSVAQGAVKQAESTQEASSEVDNLNQSLEDTRDYVRGVNDMAGKANEVSAEGLNSVKDLIVKSEKTAEKSRVSLSVMEEMVAALIRSSTFPMRSQISHPRPTCCH